MLINIISWLVIGAVAGWLGGLVMNMRSGLIVNIVVGIIGAFIGGFVMNFLGKAGATGFNLWSLLVAFVGAVILLAIIKLVKK